nr:ribbon-helix-helix protein, CopG family [Paracoccus liaowanqingii]
MTDAKEVQVSVRMPTALADRLDANRRQAGDLLSRPEAIRRLIEQALPDTAQNGQLPAISNELLKGCKRPDDLLSEAGLMKELKIRLMERKLGAELTAHLGYEAGAEA